MAFCPQCEMPLLAHSDFCSACGNSVRAAAKTDRAAIRAGAGAAPVGGTPPEGPATDGEVKA
jgi:predicted amidophosphoribosyltransferase